MSKKNLEKSKKIKPNKCLAAENDLEPFRTIYYLYWAWKYTFLLFLLRVLLPWVLGRHRFRFGPETRCSSSVACFCPRRSLPPSRRPPSGAGLRKWPASSPRGVLRSGIDSTNGRRIDAGCLST